MVKITGDEFDEGTNVKIVFHNDKDSYISMDMNNIADFKQELVQKNTAKFFVGNGIGINLDKVRYIIFKED